jgi:hypothetical protein
MKMQPGTVSVVSNTIVALVGKEPAGQRDPSMPKVRDAIAATLRDRREQLLRAAYLAAGRTKARVGNHQAQRIVETQGKLPPTPSSAPPK